jgi:hypothetical protein
MNKGKDLSVYREAMKRDKQEIVAFPNIDNKKYPDIFFRNSTKAVSV